jgi:hypothetical protein
MDRDHRWLELSMPWALICLYSLISGLIASVGRHQLGLQAFRAVRYFTFGIPFWVGLLPLVYLSCKSISGAASRFPARVALIAAVIMIPLTALDLFRAWHTGQHFSQERQCAQMICRFSPVAVDRSSFGNFVWGNSDVSASVATIAELGKLNLLCFPLETGTSPGDYIRSSTAADAAQNASGLFETVVVSRAGMRANGWAFWPQNNKRVDAIVIAADQRNGHWRLIAVTGQTFLPRVGPSAKDHPPPANCGWCAVFDPTRVPGIPLISGTELRAYAYDASDRALQQIPGRCTVP